MNADDPILQVRRCDARLPSLGIVCELQAGHEGTHEAGGDPLELAARLRGERLHVATAEALSATRRYVDVLEAGAQRLQRQARTDRVVIVVLLLVDVMLLGLRLAGA